VDSSSLNAKDLQRAVEFEKLQQLCKGIPSSIAAGTALALVVAATQSLVISFSVIAGWLALVVIVSLLRLFLVRQQSKDIAANHLHPNALSRVRLSVLMGGLVWGTAGFLLFPSDSSIHQIYLAFALGGLTAGGIIAYAIDIGCAYDYVLPALLPFVVRLVIEGDWIHLSMALTVILFLIFAVVSIRRINANLTENIILRIHATEYQTQTRSIQDQLAKSVEQFKSLTELSSDWYWEQDENFRFTRFAGQTAYNLMVSNNQLLGKTRWEIGALNLSAADWQAHRAILEAHKSFLDLELMRQDVNGNTYWSCISGRPVFDPAGKFKGYHGIGRIITDRKLAEDKSRQLTFFDTVTGLPNRHYLISRLSQAISTSSRTQQLGALMFIDLDNLKHINDTYGHQLGDLLLQQVAQRLPASLRESDTIARLGGEEFVVLLENLGGNALGAARKAEILGEKLLAELNKPYLLGGNHYTGVPSIGLALIDATQPETTEELMRRADSAMHQAKDAGRNAVRFFDRQLQLAINQRSAMETELRLSIDKRQFTLHYQAQVNTERRVTGAEALIRWNHPHRGMLLPGEFITLAEDADLILPLGNWVLETACRQLALWSTQPETADLTLAVNVSMRQLRHANFLEQVVEILKVTGANPSRLKMEITEGQLLDDSENTIAKMVQLKVLGIGFSLDDFGTGYSSLTHLTGLPLDQVKIDQTLVRHLLTDPDQAALAQAVLSLGYSLGLSVIAEGVETQGQLDFLAENGCTAYQGYFFGRPVPIDELKLTHL
jgi:diguanylate cyclase (GGDEF)-like protein/PAS domain S-box-containing protein